MQQDTNGGDRYRERLEPPPIAIEAGVFTLQGLDSAVLLTTPQASSLLTNCRRRPR